MDSMANVSWDTSIYGVDITDQRIIIRGGDVVSELSLSGVNATFCGLYSCSATDRYTVNSSTAITNVDVITGITWGSN